MKYAIWDFDGTLGYRSGMWSGAMIELLDQERPEHTVTTDQLRPYLQEGFPWHVPEHPHTDLATADEWWATLTPLFERAYEGVGFPPAQAQQLAQEIRSIYLAANRWKRYDDAIPTLESLSADGWTHLILSNHVPELSTLVEQVGLSSNITRTFTSATIGYEKPHPYAFQTVLDAIEDDDPVVWMIGDSMRADIAGAEALDIPSILVRRPCEDATHYCADLSGIPAIIRSSVS
jgi:putative hydrolase of the HAD superfamily